MLDSNLLAQIAEGLFAHTHFEVAGQRLRVGKTRTSRLRTVQFAMDGRHYEAIEQNPEKPSRWGLLARDGHRVVQIRDLASSKYVGVIVDGKVTEYGRIGRK